MKTVPFALFVVHSFLASFVTHLFLFVTRLFLAHLFLAHLFLLFVCGSLFCHSLFLHGLERVLNKLKDLSQFLVRCGPKHYNHAGSL